MGVEVLGTFGGGEGLEEGGLFGGGGVGAGGPLRGVGELVGHGGVEEWEGGRRVLAIKSRGNDDNIWRLEDLDSCESSDESRSQARTQVI